MQIIFRQLWITIPAQCCFQGSHGDKTLKDFKIVIKIENINYYGSK